MTEKTDKTDKTGEAGAAGKPATAPHTGAAETGAAPRAKEIGGRKGPDPTRYGDWEKNGRCIDF